jgi:hypothetical protein
VPEADRSGTQDVPSADKQNDERSGMDPELATVLQAWPALPEAIRPAILTLVRASCRQGVSSLREREPLTLPRLPLGPRQQSRSAPIFHTPGPKPRPREGGAPPSGEAPRPAPKRLPEVGAKAPQAKNTLCGFPAPVEKGKNLCQRPPPA